MNHKSGQKPRVVLTRRWPKAVEQTFCEHFEVQLNEHDVAFSAADLRQAFSQADAVCPTVTDRIEASLFSAPDLRVRILGNYGVGYNHIDLEAAKARNVTVTNTPGVLTDATADLAMTLILMLARRALAGEREIREGRWQGWRPTHLLGSDLSGKTLGIVGFGRIGQAVARRAHHGFGMRVLFNTPRPPAPAQAAAVGAANCAELKDLLAQSDFVSLHCPATPATRQLLNAERLALMKPGSFLVNTARGDLIDEAALVVALQDGHLGGAGLDVYSAEPAVPEALRRRDDVVLLPHLGSATLETRTAMGLRVLENLQAFFASRQPPDRVI